MREHGGGAPQALCRAQGGARVPLQPRLHWQQEFEDAFEYDLTPDQVTAVADIKARHGITHADGPFAVRRRRLRKTEVAMRAAFKAVMDGKQVAVLAPTTVLAFQHEKTVKERFAGFPVRAEMVSRFRTKAEQKAVLDDLATGKVDIIVGTHRLLSKDVQFRDLDFWWLTRSSASASATRKRSNS